MGWRKCSARQTSPQTEYKNLTNCRGQRKFRAVLDEKELTYAAHNSRVLEEAKTALVTGEIRTPSVGSLGSEEKEEIDSDLQCVGNPSSTSTSKSSGEEYMQRNDKFSGNKEIILASEDRDYSQESEDLLPDESDNLEEFGGDNASSVQHSYSSVRTTETASQSSAKFKESKVPDVESETLQEVGESSLRCRATIGTVWTRSVAAVMRGEANVTAAAEVTGKPNNLKKSSEAFVPWKEPHNAGGRAESENRLTPRSARTGKRKTTSNSSFSAALSSHRLSLLNESGVAAPADGCGSPREPSGGQLRHLTGFRHSRGSDGVTYFAKVTDSGVHGNESASVEEGLGSGSSSPHVQREVSRGREPPRRAVPSKTACAVERRSFLRSTGGETHIMSKVQGTRNVSTQGRSYRGEEKGPCRVVWEDQDELQGRTRSESTTAVLHEDNGSSDHDKQDVYDRVDIAQEEEEDLHYPENNFEDVGNDTALVGFEVQREMDDGVDETEKEDANQVTDFSNLAFENESTKRRERRQAQAMREREGQRRRKEGLPRNFLLVDEYTKKPYGVGVGEWRKELMLLSRKLDPSVGNINQHPGGAVAEIADWIQHTWEYSAPVRFECVKEVVARGVALRRSDIWKKIRNNEPKPDDVTDRAWRTLRRQLESPATMRKIESCSRANASRVNFGRTGPSGEVGVRERLRKWLCRSPDPEEIMFEMARNKGYGGRSLMNTGNTNVMHGSAPRAQAPTELSLMKGPIDISKKGRSPHGKVQEAGEDGGEEGDVQLPTDAGHADGAVERGVLAISNEQILQHPLVLKMMQRLEALEGRPSSSGTDQRNSSFDVARSYGRWKVADEEEEDGDDEGFGEGKTPRILNRLKRRREQS